MTKFNLSILYLFIMLLFFSCTLKKESYPADNDNKEFSKSSGIEISTLSEEQTENLVTLGKIWGFLKYYHPAIAKGNYNWDYELFRILPEILNVDSKQQRDSVLINWIEKLGNFRQGKPLKENKDIVIYPDLNWIDSSGFDPKLVTLLQKVKNAKRTSEHYYIEISFGIIHFKENKYINMPFPDVGYRLLSLFRYWNIINYYFPYKNLTDTPWEEVLPEFIPKFINAKNRFEYRLTALEMVTKTNDSHSFYYGLDLYRENKIVPAEIVFIGDTAVVSGFFKKDFEKSTELKKGDIILKINDKSIDNMINERKKYMPASNRETLLRDMSSELLQTDKEHLKIEYSRDSMIYQTVIPTCKKPFRMPDKYNKTDTCFKLIKPNISYLYLGSLKEKYLQDLLKEIEKTKGLVIDLRCYPGDNFIHPLSDFLMKNSTLFTKFSTGSISHPGTFTYNVSYIGRSNKQYYKGKVAILVNEITQSLAETSTIAYRTRVQAKVFGTHTAGANGDITNIFLPGGIETCISGAGMYYPDGGQTQRIGILPDVVVKPTIQGIKEGRDEVLEKAIEWIKEK